MLTKDKKYKLIKSDNPGLFKIKALRNFNGVKKNSIGGYIEKEENLSHEGDCWVYGNAEVFGNARVYGNAEVFGDVVVFGNAQVFENATVYGNAIVYGNARAYGNAQVYGNVLMYDNAIVYGNATVCDNAVVYGNAMVYGNALIGNRSRAFGQDVVTSNIINVTGLPNDIITITDNHINIGCKQYTAAEWLEKGKEIGKTCDYSDAQIKLSLDIIKLPSKKERSVI